MSVLSALGLAAAAVCLAALSVLLRERRVARDGEALIARTESPSVLTDIEGGIIAANAAMQWRAPGARRLASLFAAILRGADDALLYRMARDARANGCAHAVLPGGPDGSGGQLLVRTLESGRLAWTVLPEGAGAVLHDHGARLPYAQAPFAHARVAPDGSAAVNAAFAASFGEEPARILADLDAAEAGDDDRVLLTTVEGRHRVWRHFTALNPSSGLRDVFLHPVPETDGVRASPMGILDCVPAAIMQLELDGRVFWCNARARTLFGGGAEPGAALGDLVTPLGRGAETLVAEATEGRGTVTEMAHLREAETYLEITLSRVRLYGRDTLIAAVTDASEVRRLEDQFTQSQKMEAVGKLAGGVAHDFNNVLTAIIGHCDLLLLRKEAGDPDYADLMQIVQNANRAAALVRQLLAFSRKQTLNPVTLSVREVISDAHYLLDRLVGETVRLDLEFGGDLWPVRADPQQLEQVLMNLVVNARDAVQGSGAVTIVARNEAVADGDPALARGIPAGDHVVIGVRDTGPGIDPSIRDKIFDPFFTTKAKGEGTGLGLSTVYGIVRQSGGHILAGGAPGGGAEILIYLPRSSAGEQADARAPAQPQRDMTGSASVMLVEDEAPVRAFAARALKLRGYEVCEAETAEDAMEILADRDHRVDLLISDVVMPGMSGPAFATEARKLRPGLRLIFVSGYAEEDFRESLTESDFLFLAKPFTLNQLTTKVKEALGDAG